MSRVGFSRRLGAVLGRSDTRDENAAFDKAKAKDAPAKGRGTGTGASRRGPFADLTNSANARDDDRILREKERVEWQEKMEREKLKRELREQEEREEREEREKLKRELREQEERRQEEKREREAQLAKQLEERRLQQAAEEREERARASLRDPKNWIEALEPVDKPVAKDIRYVAEYANDIIERLRVHELQFPGPGQDYLSAQEVITDKMRAILVDWLVEVHLKFKLSEETLFLTVAMLDRFLAKKSVARNQLQLVGVTCLLLAAKYVEVYAPEVRDFVQITDRAYTRREILEMEVTVLRTLNFRLTLPSPLVFLQRFCRLLGSEPNPQLENLAQYILELALVDHRMVKYAPSHLAAASLLLANKVMKKSEPWPHALSRASHATEQSLRPCAKEMCALLQGAEKSSLQAVRKKFSLEKYRSVAKLLSQ